MRARDLLLPPLALAAAGILILPGERGAHAWALSGNSLGLPQRDFRVFNNFNDIASNDNTTPDPNFPGYNGAVLSIWKAAVEWGSGLHGDGGGDPHQPGGLGSGGANFDLSFQGLALSPGNSSANTHAGISGCGAGVLAYTGGNSNGWAIRYCDSNWTFEDGPHTFIGGNKDIQGTAAHEIGHSLGLGHSTDGSATMLSGAPSDAVSWRSISPDDIAGLQAIYGAKSSTKPTITGVSLSGSSLSITGTNFSPTGNDVWLTKLAIGGDGVPVMVADVPSSGGVITVSVPGDAGPGDVLVKVPGSGHAALSNAWPFAPGPPQCGATQYGTNLGGANIATLDTSDNPVAGTSVTIALSGFQGDGTAMMMITALPTEQAVFGGTVLINYQDPLLVLNVPVVAGAGAISLTLPAAGVQGYFQAGLPDASQPGGWAFSNGLHIVICP